MAGKAVSKCIARWTGKALAAVAIATLFVLCSVVSNASAQIFDQRNDCLRSNEIANYPAIDSGPGWTVRAQGSETENARILARLIRDESLVERMTRYFDVYPRTSVPGLASSGVQIFVMPVAELVNGDGLQLEGHATAYCDDIGDSALGFRVAGAMFGFNPTAGKHVFVHEFTHILQGAAVYGGRRDAPYNLLEPTAEWAAEHFLRDGLAAETDEDFFFENLTRPLTYLDRESGSGGGRYGGWRFFAWLEAKLGEARFQDFIKELFRRGAGSQALAPLMERLGASIGARTPRLAGAWGKFWSDHMRVGAPDGGPPVRAQDTRRIGLGSSTIALRARALAIDYSQVSFASEVKKVTITSSGPSGTGGPGRLYKGVSTSSGATYDWTDGGSETFCLASNSSRSRIFLLANGGLSGGSDAEIRIRASRELCGCPSPVAHSSSVGFGFRGLVGEAVTGPDELSSGGGIPVPGPDPGSVGPGLSPFSPPSFLGPSGPWGSMRWHLTGRSTQDDEDEDGRAESYCYQISTGSGPSSGDFSVSGTGRISTTNGRDYTLSAHLNANASVAKGRGAFKTTVNISIPNGTLTGRLVQGRSNINFLSGNVRVDVCDASNQCQSSNSSASAGDRSTVRFVKTRSHFTITQTDPDAGSATAQLPR